MVSSISNMVNRCNDDRVDEAREEVSVLLGDVDETAMKSVFGTVSSGLVTRSATVINGTTASRPVETTASTFTRVSGQPAATSICMQAISAARSRLSEAERPGLSVVSLGHGSIPRHLVPANDHFADVAQR
jgi:hypothetical protein